MARFPTREADIRALAQNIITGLIGNANFPDPPVSPQDLQELLDALIALEDAQVAAQAAAQQATQAKQDGLDRLTTAMKKVLHYLDL